MIYLLTHGLKLRLEARYHKELRGVVVSREQWNTIRQMRGFYVRAYRWMQVTLMILTAVTLFLTVIICYLYLTQGESSFYATSGETPPRILRPMTHANDSSTPLLADDQTVIDRKQSTMDI